MAEHLVPIAISSQLDVTGEERIHAANSSGIGAVRPSYLNIEGDLEDALVGAEGTYEYDIDADAGPYVVTLLSGSLPIGAVINDQGEITFQYETPGTYEWELQVEDSLGNLDTVEDTVTIGPMTLSGDAPDGDVGDDIDVDYIPTGGAAPITFAVTVGSLPPGTTLNASTGNLSGEYTTGGSFSWTITATDFFGNTATEDDTAEVIAILAILGSVGDGEVGTAYSDTLDVVEGVPPYSNVSIVAGALPPGLNISLLADEITIDGTPT